MQICFGGVASLVKARYQEANRPGSRVRQDVRASQNVPRLTLSRVPARTAEEITARRREDRKAFKEERARALLTAQEEAEAAFAAGKPLPAPFQPEAVRQATRSTPEPSHTVAPTLTESAADATAIEPIEDLEYLQLTLQEAFFLAWALGSLRVLDSATVCRSHCLIY